ncbi:MAG: CDP-alcohol phosphatidyltransferase family protein [Gemmatimonadales bacterium]
MSPAGERPAASGRWTVADLLTFSRFPLAVVFVAIPSAGWRIAILCVAGVTDLIDGWAARRWGSSRLGVFLDPVADKVFAAAAFGVVLFDGALELWEIVAVLARDLVATIGFLVTVIRRKPVSIPARISGKLVTAFQLATLLAFLLQSSWLRPLAWLTGLAALYAIADYTYGRHEARAL